jgi:hypothetical protein
VTAQRRLVARSERDRRRGGNREVRNNLRGASLGVLTAEIGRFDTTQTLLDVVSGPLRALPTCCGACRHKRRRLASILLTNRSAECLLLTQSGHAFRLRALNLLGKPARGRRYPVRTHKHQAFKPRARMFGAGIHHRVQSRRCPDGPAADGLAYPLLARGTSTFPQGPRKARAEIDPAGRGKCRRGQNATRRCSAATP